MVEHDGLAGCAFLNGHNLSDAYRHENTKTDNKREVNDRRRRRNRGEKSGKKANKKNNQLEFADNDIKKWTRYDMKCERRK